MSDKWDKLNKEFDDKINSLTHEDWVKWDKHKLTAITMDKTALAQYIKRLEIEKSHGKTISINAAIGLAQSYFNKEREQMENMYKLGKDDGALSRDTEPYTKKGSFDMLYTQSTETKS